MEKLNKEILQDPSIVEPHSLIQNGNQLKRPPIRKKGTLDTSVIKS